MKVLVCGARGCVGRAVASALRSRGHKVVEGARGLADGPFSLHVDYSQARAPADWAAALSAAQISVVVNCVGILMPSSGQTFERVHSEGPIELFRGAALAGVSRVIQVSALGVSGEPDSMAMPYLHSKWLADEALAGMALDWAVLRPSLVYGPRSQSAALFATLASLPLIGLPGRGLQAVQPLHVFELAEAIALLVERKGALRCVHELGGPQALSYREMLAQYRAALGFGPALWLPVPMFLMKATAWMAECLPQQAFCRDTVRLLERGSAPASNGAPSLLGRQPTTLAQGLAVSPPQPLLDLRVQLSPAVSATLRASLGFLWLYTALVTLALPHESGVLRLLAHCGFEENTAWAVMIGSCLLNGVMGVATLWRPSPAVYLLQASAVLGYSVTAALNMPELTIDHCGPLAKNAPVLALVLLLAMAQPLDLRAAQAGRVRRSRAPATNHAVRRALADDHRVA
jgi:uncharacterized protein YbjT (DUF2867 family)